MNSVPVPEVAEEDDCLRLLFFGDVFGEGGRKAVSDWIPKLREELDVDFVIVNGENSAAGRGITPKIAIGLMRAGAAVVTSGDHIWDQKEIVPYLADEPRMLRPLNYPEGVPGSGSVVLETKKGKVAVINALGRVFMGPQVDNPFTLVAACAERLREETPVIFVDFHAEATSEKVALGWYLDGKVSAVVGTHTHVPTADERVLPGGTAYLTDAGMCGPYESVIGSQIEPVVGRFLNAMPTRFGMGRGMVRVNAVFVEVERLTGRARRIERVTRDWAE
jgi:metallophosphoesterase (TIGR00282 family)